MTGWVEVRRAVAQRFRIQHDEEAWVGFFPREPPELAEQLVRIERVTVRDADWLLLLSPVCFEDDLPHRDALVHNLRLPVGALALDEDHYELKVALALGAADEGAICDLAQKLAVEADRLRRVYQSRARAVEMLSHFVD